MLTVMTLAVISVIAGLALLVWSADRFVEGAAMTARHFGMPALLIGMVVVGFGTSAPELVVSALAALQGNPGIALGNAYGSNIANIGVILGLTALLSPVTVRSQVLRSELPLLLAVTALSGWLLRDGSLTTAEGVLMLLVFALLLGWSIWRGRSGGDALGDEMGEELASHPLPLRQALFWLVAGLLLLVGSSRLLVWGAVEIASGLGVSDLVIGLTIIAIGTSLPELASAIIAARKGEHDLALGNVIGSNLFNTLGVVGLAAAIAPIAAGPEVLSRDFFVMGGLTLALFLMGFGLRRPGRINRLEGGGLLLAYGAYLTVLLRSAF